MSGRNDRIRELYEAALKRPIGDRAAFVSSHSEGDKDLELRVVALLTGQQDTELPGHERGTDGAPLLAAGTQIGHYRIDGPLGAGGMGVVYRATDTKLNRPAAIKVLPESLADPEARRRFQREAQTASSLNHPHIVTVHDAGEYLGRQYLITEYVDGGTLRAWAARPRGWRSIVELLVGVADAVAVAHEAGILHRDIKPENILLAKNGYAKLADFGLAKLLETDPLADDAFAGMRPDAHSSLVGTAAYMSPEQAQGMPLDGRSDVYSFGLVLHELLSGVRPDATRAIDQRHGGEPAALAKLGDGVPAELRTLVVKALEHDPADRYQTMRELVIDLRRVVRGGELRAMPTTGDAIEPAPVKTGPVAPPQRFADRRLWYFSATLVLLAVLGFAARDALFGGYPETSVAVLPFVNETGDPRDVAISEGIGDALRDRLMTLPGLSVQARASSISFRDQNVDMPTIAATLEVGRLINASVRRTGRTFEVVVEVLNDRGFAVQPALRFQGTEAGLQAMQQEIAAQVTQLLAPETQSVVADAPVTPTSASEKANLLVLFGSRAERQLREALVVDEAKLAEAIDFYRQATVADPNAIAAHARLAGLLVYSGDTEGARAPLARAIDLGRAIGPSYAAADLSDAYFATAQFLLRTRSTGIGTAYQQAIELNPNNVDALGAYAQWLMIHGGVTEADDYFREAIRLDRRSLSRYQDHAEFLGILEDMQGVREVGDDILSRFPEDPRAYLALARIYEITGDIDVGIAWGLKALRLLADDDDARGQIGELYARIDLFEEASELDPGPRMYIFYYQRRYDELIALAQELVLTYPDDVSAKYMLGFAYNATGDFADAKYILEAAGIAGVRPGAEYMSGGADNEALTSYADALRGLDPNDSLARELAVERIGLPPELAIEARATGAGLDTSWWVNVGRACAYAQIGEYVRALDLLDRVKDAQGLVRSPLVQDSPCFTALAGEPRYRALLDRIEERKQMLRERLAATLQEHRVAGVRAAVRASPASTQ